MAINITSGAFEPESRSPSSTRATATIVRRRSLGMVFQQGRRNWP